MGDAPVVAVAFSGGRDSTALLHATVSAATRVGCRVLALHIHHGLNLDADRWLAHCESFCRRLAEDGADIAFSAERLRAVPAPGDSIEAWARRARYEALGRLARAGAASVVLLGHHRRDQAETFLLQALRAGGVAGLAAMPARIERDGLVWLRPWLRCSREGIDAYVHRHRLEHIEDGSNADPRFARNRLRRDVWPALAEAFPEAEVTLARSAAWAAEADAALDEWAAIDLQSVCESDGGVDVTRWSGLSPARRSMVLRRWLAERSGAVMPATLVYRLMSETRACRSGRWPAPGGELRLYRGVLRFHPSTPARAAVVEARLSIRRAGSYALPGWGGRLQARRVVTGGVALAWLGQLELRAREGGERFQAGPGRPPRSLKKQYQAAGLGAADRRGPLVYSGGLLLFVPGLGIDARVVAPPGQPAMALAWSPAEAAIGRQTVER